MVLLPYSTYQYFWQLLSFAAGVVVCLSSCSSHPPSSSSSSRHQYARSVQALVSHSLSQGLFFLLMMLSLERWELDGLCFTAGLLVHYAILVCFLWLTVRPVILVLRETQRRLYEKTCFIMPLTLVAWGRSSFSPHSVPVHLNPLLPLSATPTIPVLIYAIVTVANGLYQLDL